MGDEDAKVRVGIGAELYLFESGLSAVYVSLQEDVVNGGTIIDTTWGKYADKRAIAYTLLLSSLGLMGQCGIVSDAFIAELMRRFVPVIWEHNDAAEIREQLIKH